MATPIIHSAPDTVEVKRTEERPKVHTDRYTGSKYVNSDELVRSPEFRRQNERIRGLVQRQRDERSRSGR